MEREEKSSNEYSEDTDSLFNKKTFIQNEIIDKKYDIDDFTFYLRKVKGTEDIDLSKWSLEEIQSMVFDYQHDNNKKHDQEDYITVNEKISGIVDDDNKAYYDHSADEDDQVNYIATIKQMRGELSDYDILTIHITDAQKISGLFFIPSNYEFTIEIAELGTTVKRTLRDFEFLKETLELYYPTTYIPSLPTFALFSLSKPNYLQRKANYLKMFLTSLSQNKLVMSTDLFRDFLKLSSEDFTTLKKEFDDTDPPTKIKKFPTMEGMLVVTTDPEKDNQAEFIRKNIIAKTKTYQKLNSAIKDVLLEFNVISYKMHNLSLAFNAIAQEHSDIPYAKQVYTDFEELTKRYANSYINQQKFFKQDLQQYFKYTNKIFTDFNAYVDDFEKSKTEYFSQYVSHDKITTLGKRDLEKLDLLRKTYGYCLNRVLNEHDRLKHVTAESLEYHLKDINGQKEKMFEDYLAFVSLLEGRLDNQTKEAI